MKKVLVLFCLLTGLAAGHGLLAESVKPKGKVEVLAVKGKVLFNAKVLHKKDRFEFKPNINAINQLEFAGSTDWIKVKEIGTGKIFSYYKQKKYACTNCLGTRGTEDVPKALSGYFGKKTIFLFEPDTLIFKRNSGFGSKALVVFRIYLEDKIFESIVGDYDTIIVSRDRLYDFAEKNNILWPSFQTDSIRMIYSIPETKEIIIPQLPVFNVIFFEDAVSYLFQAGLEIEEIYNELAVSFVLLQDIKNAKHFTSDSEAEQWLKGKIRQHMNYLKQNNKKHLRYRGK